MSDYVPDSVLPEILSRLPVESLLRFRCVCKHWYSLISSPHFVNLHLSHSLSSPTPLLVLRHISFRDRSNGPRKRRRKITEHYSVYLDPSMALVKGFKHPMPNKLINPFRVVGFCNGLFCFSNDHNGDKDTIILWNPAIRKTLLLPKPSFNKFRNFLGFGVDPKTHDFKVVTIAYQLGDDGYLMQTPKVEVYSLSTCLWKMVNTDFIRSEEIYCNLNIFYRNCYMNGAIHWVAYYRNKDGILIDCLLVFDLSDDTFRKIDCPLGLENLGINVTLYGEHLSLICYDRGGHRGGPCYRCVVWVMYQYGEPESWTEKFVVVLESGILHAIGFMGNGEILLENYGGNGNLLSYDPVNKEFKDHNIRDAFEAFFLSKYIESLALLDRTSGASTNPYDAVSDWPS